MHLVIDTSTERGVIAIGDGKALIFHCELPFGLNHAAHLFPELEKEFHRSNITMDSIEGIVVGIGPGSYTGIRVAVMAAKALAYGRKLPLIGVSALEGLTPDGDGPFASVIDAKVGGIYFLHGIRSGENITYTTSPFLCAIENAERELENVQTIVTPNQKPLLARLSDFSHNAKWQEKTPNAHWMLKLALYKPQTLFTPQHHLDILYLR